MDPRSVVLADGRRVATRRAEFSDRAAIVDFYEHLSERSRYDRFFHPTPRLTGELREFLTDLEHAEVWLAFDGITCVGESRIAPHHGRDGADLALTVADSHRHAGLGRHLARRAVTEQHHDSWITISILPSNPAALRLARREGVALHFEGGVVEGRIVTSPKPLEEAPTVFNHDPKIERLATVDLFRRCTRRQLRDVAKLTTEIDAARGAVLCREGESGRECFVVRDGQATVTIAGEEVATLGPGDFFGELALLDGEPRIATVTAASDMRLFVLSRRDFNELVTGMSTVSRHLLTTVGARLRAADARLRADKLSA